MWTRAQLKANAKEKLRLYYWSGVIVSLIYSFIGGGFGGFGSGFSSAVSGGGTATEQLEQTFEYSHEISSTLILILSIVVIIAAIAGTAFSAFLVNPLFVGVKRFFLKSGEQKTELTELLFAFKKGCYLNVVKTMFLRQLYVFLWSLLFIVPGIIKGYEYYMVPYLLAENPEMSSREVFALSREMMAGEKWRTFVLELSFYGWLFLGTLACGIGTIFVTPYMEATFVELFLALKAKIYYRRQSAEPVF